MWYPQILNHPNIYVSMHIYAILFFSYIDTYHLRCLGCFGAMFFGTAPDLPAIRARLPLLRWDPEGVAHPAAPHGGDLPRRRFAAEGATQRHHDVLPNEISWVVVEVLYGCYVVIVYVIMCLLNMVRILIWLI